MGCQSSKHKPVGVEEPTSNGNSRRLDHPVVVKSKSPASRTSSDRTQTSSVTSRQDQADQRDVAYANGVAGLSIEDLYESLNGSNHIGRGQFGFVHQMRRLSDGMLVAVKTTKPTPLDHQRSGEITSYDSVSEKCQEVHTLLRIRGGQHVLQLVEFFWMSYDGSLRLVTELLHMNLREWLIQQNQLTEKQVRDIARSILKGLHFLDQCNIVHRDLKEDNIMFRRLGDVNTLTIVDFGFARELGENEKVTDVCGSRGYLAPEIYLRKPYGTEVDMFSFGVAIFRILTATKPWPEGPSAATEEATLQLQYRIDRQQWSTISRPAKDLIRQCLSYAPERISPLGALNHSFVQGKSDSVLQVDGSSFFPGAQARQTSRAIIEDPLVAESRNTTGLATSEHQTRFWLGGEMVGAVDHLIESGFICGRIVARKANKFMLDEPRMRNELLLPQFIATLPRYTELECRNIFRQIVLGVQAFHQAGLAHRNLNPSNFIVHYGVGEDGIQLCIKGLQFVQPAAGLQSITGRVGPSQRNSFDWFAYVAPEIDTNFVHDARVDLWSLGTLLYTLVCGIGPFTGSADEIIARKNKGSVSFPVVQPSPYVQTLIKGLLQVAPSRRLSVHDVLNHAWMVQPKTALLSHDLKIAHSIFLDYNRKS